MFSSVLNKNLNWEILLIYFFTYFQNCRFKGVGGWGWGRGVGKRSGEWCFWGVWYPNGHYSLGVLLKLSFIEKYSGLFNGYLKIKTFINGDLYVLHNVMLWNISFQGWRFPALYWLYQKKHFFLSIMVAIFVKY